MAFWYALRKLVTAGWLRGADGKTALLVSAFAIPWNFELSPVDDLPAGLFVVPFGKVENVVGEQGEVLSVRGSVAEDDVLAAIIRPIVVMPLDGVTLSVTVTEWGEGGAGLVVETGRSMRIEVSALDAGEPFELVVNGERFVEEADKDGVVVVEVGE